MAIDTDIAQLEHEVAERFRRHPDAPVLLSMLGFGVVSAATLVRGR